jgi:hypothetical protein
MQRYVKLQSYSKKSRNRLIVINTTVRKTFLGYLFLGLIN